MPNIVDYLKSRAEAEQEQEKTNPDEPTAEEIAAAIEEALS